MALTLRATSLSSVQGIAAAAGLAVLVLTGVSCEGVPLVAPSGTAITLVASPDSLTSGGASDITAILVEGAQGAPNNNGQFEVINGVGTLVHDGTHVSFLTTLGRVVPAEATTKNGRATVRLFPDGATGTAVITAYSGGSSQTVEVVVSDGDGSGH